MSLDITLYYEIDGNEIEVFEANTTHNLNKMAKEANLYEAMWRPDEYAFDYAEQAVDFLQDGLTNLIANTQWFKKFNSPNGYGKYEDLVEVVEQYLKACKKYPSAKIKVWR